MTRDEIKNTPEIVDFMLDESITANSRMKLRKRLEELCKLAIKALEQEPCEDAISRQSVLDCLTVTKLKKFDFILCAREEIKKLPPVTPIRPKGHWIRVAKDKLRCSECDLIHFIAQYPQGKIAWCPNCGAKMQEVEENGDK